jgi:hypothetical protein
MVDRSDACVREVGEGLGLLVTVDELDEFVVPRVATRVRRGLGHPGIHLEDGQLIVGAIAGPAERVRS